MINRKLLSYFGLSPTGDFGPFTFYTAKNKKPVWFVKAPPTKPPTDRQLYQRYFFSTIALMWKNLEEDVRANWETASKRAHLRMTGYNLFVWYQAHRDDRIIETIEHQSGVQLLT